MVGVSPDVSHKGKDSYFLYQTNRRVLTAFPADEVS